MPAKIDAQVEDGVTHQFFRRIHQSKKRLGSSDADQCHDDAADDGEGIDRMNTVVHLFAVPGSEELGDDDGSTGSQPGKKVDQQVDDHSGGTRRPRQVHFSRQSVPQ